MMQAEEETLCLKLLFPQNIQHTDTKFVQIAKDLITPAPQTLPRVF